MGTPYNNSERKPVSLRRRVVSLPTLISFGLAAVLLALLVTRFDIDLGEVWADLRRSDPLFFLLAVAVHYTTFLFRGARWRLLLRNAQGKESHVPGAIHCGRLILLGWFVNSVTWFRLGDAYRAYAYTEDVNASFSRTIGTVLAERVIDMALVFLLLSIAVLALVAAGIDTSGLFVGLAALLLVAVMLLLVAMRFFRQRLAHLLSPRLKAIFERFYQGTVGSFRKMPLVGVLGLMAWMSEFARLFFVAKALGLTLAIPMVVFVTLANAILTLVPFTPGGLGIVEPGITGLLGLSLDKGDAIAVVVLDRSISYLSIIAAGAILFALREILKRRSRGKGKVMVAE